MVMVLGNEGLWAVIKSWGLSPHEQYINALIKEAQKKFCEPFCHVKIQQKSVACKKPHGGILISVFQPPEQLEINLLFMLPSLWYFIIAAWTG